MSEGEEQEVRPTSSLINADPNQLMLFQLPDSLPGRTPEDKEEDATSDEKKLVKTKDTKMCTLEHLDEGLIGKIVRHQSGKLKLHLGNSIYDVNEGLKSDFQQNAVVIDANSEQRSANMYSLGIINKKFNISPDWDYLFHKMTP
jgi:RNA polymerase III RPC4